MRLIDADALKETIDREIFRHDTIDHVFQIIDDAPTIEPKQGEWIAKTENYHSHWVCSECGSWALLEWNEQMCLSKYCPNCGAKMKGADDE